MKQLLSLETLGNLDRGRVGVAINKGILTLIKDMNNRGSVITPRLLNISVSMKPASYDEAGDLEQIVTDVTIEARTPKLISSLTTMDINKHSETLTFNDHSPDDPKQGTLDELTQDQLDGGVSD